MDDESQKGQSAQTVAMSNRDLLSILVLGGIAGLLIWGLGLVLDRYVFDVFLCQNGVGGQCSHAMDYAAGVAVVIGSILALAGLIRLRVYRPLLAVLATAISLWGVVQLTWGMKWYWGILVAIIMYLLAYGLYTWAARLRLFWIALAVTAVLVIAVRLALMI
jgi:hypothetical protein